MNKKRTVIFILSFLLLAVCPHRVSAAWKTTPAGTIYTKSKSPGYCTGWKKINGSKYYFDPATGVMSTGFRKIEKKGKTYTYYFGTDGKCVSGMAVIDGVRYYFNKNGRMQLGFIRLGSKTYYADPSNGMLVRNVWIDGGFYFQDDCTMAVNTTIDGKRVGADGRYTGTSKNIGFVRSGGKTLYYNRKGIVVTGWLTIGGTTYYLRPSVATGFFKVGNYTYYAQADGVVLKNTWRGKRLLTASGAMATGWTTVGNKRYYFNPSGDYVTGKKKIGEKTFRFDEKGVLHTNYWYRTKNKAYYYGADGARVSGLQKIGNYYYYFNKKGRLKKGFIKAADGSLYYGDPQKGFLMRGKWFTVEKFKYYAGTDCALAVGVNKLGGKIYGFAENGRMFAKTWQTIDGDRYYFRKNGAAYVGRWKKISGQYYYFQSDGTLALNTVIDGYSIDASGIRVGVKMPDGWTTIAGSKHYVIKGKSVTGWQTISGSRYYFDSSGGMVTGIQEIKGKKYYFYPTGILAVNTSIAVSSKEYTINTKGVVTSEKVISASGDNLGAKIANYAIKYIGNRYVYGGTSLTGGADCSGFTMAVYQQFGISLPHNAAAQSGCGSAVSMDNLQPGDLIFYGNGISHVAMYIGGGSVVHASNSTNGIIISSYNYRSPVCARRYI